MSVLLSDHIEKVLTSSGLCLGPLAAMSAYDIMTVCVVGKGIYGDVDDTG